MKKYSFKDRFSEILGNKKISQTELSKITKIPQTTLSDWKQGKSQPRQDKIDILAKALNVSPTWLLGYDVEMEVKPKTIEDIDFTGIDRIAAEYIGEEFSEEALDEIQNFVEYVRQKNLKK